MSCQLGAEIAGYELQRAVFVLDSFKARQLVSDEATFAVSCIVRMYRDAF